MKVREENVVFLTITSWVDAGIFAKHYYGRLRALTGGESFDVTHEITQREADDFNRSLKFSGNPEDDAFIGYKKGEVSERLLSKKKVIAEAKKQFKQHFPKATVLVLGDLGVVEPQEILVGPKEFKDKVNVLVKRYEKLDWDVEVDRPEIKEIEEKWQELWPRKYT